MSFILIEASPCPHGCDRVSNLIRFDTGGVPMTDTGRHRDIDLLSEAEVRLLLAQCSRRAPTGSGTVHCSRCSTGLVCGCLRLLTFVPPTLTTNAA